STYPRRLRALRRGRTALPSSASRAGSKRRLADMQLRRNVPAVVLVHGLWLSGWCMLLLAWRLRRCGFRTYRFSYRSVRKGLRENAAALRAFSDAIDASTVHFVGHSLGGIVIQAMF